MPAKRGSAAQRAGGPGRDGMHNGTANPVDNAVLVDRRGLLLWCRRWLLWQFWLWHGSPVAVKKILSADERQGVVVPGGLRAIG